MSYVIVLANAPAHDGMPLLVAEPLFGLAATAQSTPPEQASTPLATGTSASVANTPTAQEAPASPAPASAPAAAHAAAQPDGPGAIVVMSKPRPTKADPLAPLNAEVFGVTMVVDSAIAGPTALAYKRHVPAVVRHGLRHFINNLNEPVVSLNYLVQLKLGKSLETLGRFGINSSIGIAGFIDVAKNRPFHLPFRPNGFADTMGYYGMKPGPFFYLPLIGPTTLRDLMGGAVDMAILPTAVGTPFNNMAFTLPLGTIDALDYRAEFESELEKLRAEPRDLYRARRAYYLAQRQAQIDALHSHPAMPTPPATPVPGSSPTPGTPKPN